MAAPSVEASSVKKETSMDKQTILAVLQFLKKNNLKVMLFLLVGHLTRKHDAEILNYIYKLSKQFIIALGHFRLNSESGSLDLVHSGLNFLVCIFVMKWCLQINGVHHLSRFRLPPYFSSDITTTR